jgi:hypothetical protein
MCKALDRDVDQWCQTVGAQAVNAVAIKTNKINLRFKEILKLHDMTGSLYSACKPKKTIKQSF